MGDIYGIIRRDINKIVYVGQTIRTYKRRWQQHKQVAKYKDSSHYALYAAIQKLGIDNFYPILIEQCDNSLLDDREKFWIKFYQTKVELGGYNLTDGGDTNSERQRKHIYRYNLNGEYIDEFDSIADAGWELNIDNPTHIGQAAAGKLNQAYGYRWSFLKEEKLEANNNIKKKEIKQYNLNNEYIRTFSSITEATNFLNKDRAAGSNIIAVAKGKRKQAYGYKWSY